MVLLLAMTPAIPAARVPLAASVLGYAGISGGFVAWAAREGSLRFAAGCLMLQLLDHIACGAGVASALWSATLGGGRRASRTPV